MNSGQKKGINFDLDTNALKIHYTEGDWRNAYHDVRNFFKKNGFEHIQGSGYHTLMPMSEPDVMTIVYRMMKRCPWINYCVSVCTLADVPEAFDISHVFVREAERLDEAMTSTTQGIMIIIRLKVPFGLSALALYITATTVACQEQAINPPVEHTVNWLIQAAGLHT